MLRTNKNTHGARLIEECLQKDQHIHNQPYDMKKKGEKYPQKSFHMYCKPKYVRQAIRLRVNIPTIKHVTYKQKYTRGEAP